MKLTLLLTLLLNLGIGADPLQIISTSLTVTVRDDLGNTVEGATVKLFAKEEDYTKEINPVEEAVSDKKGIAKFKKLHPESYFILGRKGDKDNAGGGAKTGVLKKEHFNKVTIIIQ